jgi:hypothetical protein
MNPKGEGIDVMYRNIRHAFFQVGGARMAGGTASSARRALHCRCRFNFN